LVDFAADDVFVIEVSPEPPQTESYIIWLIIGIVPRKGTFSFQPNDSLEAIEPFLKAKWGIDDFEMEFVLLHVESDTRHVIPKNTVLSEIQMDAEHRLSLREATTISIDVGVELMESEPKFGRKRVANDSFGSTASRCVPRENQLQLLFKLSTDEENPFPLVFAKGQTVRHAREKVAQMFECTPEDVTFLYSGKSLKDTFVLDRLRVGTNSITVCLRETEAVMLYTATGD
jgi:hypothetical protein